MNQSRTLFAWTPAVGGSESTAAAPLVCKLRVTGVVTAADGSVPPMFEAEMLRVFRGDGAVAEGQQVLLVPDVRWKGPDAAQHMTSGPRGSVRSCLDTDFVMPKTVEAGHPVYLMTLQPADPPTDEVGRPALTGTHWQGLPQGTRARVDNVGAPSASLAADVLYCLRLELLAAMDDDNADVRRSAITALRNWYGEHHGTAPTLDNVWSEPEVRPAVLRAATDTDWRVRWTAAWIMAEGRADDDANEALTRLLFDRHRIVRQPALMALSQRGLADVAGPAEQSIDYMLDDRLDAPHRQYEDYRNLKTDNFVRMMRGNPDANGADWQTRSEGAYLIGLHGRRDGAAALIEALGADHFEVRRWAAWSLGMIGGEGVAEALAGVLADEDGRVRVMAAWGLARQNDERGIEALADLLADPNVPTAAEAAEMLGRLDDPDAPLLLIEALKDGRPAVRGFAVMALRRFLDGKHAAAIRDAIASLADDPSAYVRGAAGAVGSAGGDEATPAPQGQ